MDGRHLHRKQDVLVLQILLVATLVSFGTNVMHSTKVKASSTPVVPYHLGNWTYVNKPVYPVFINDSQIPVGKNWTYVYTLSHSSRYHVYIYGSWIGTLTDYDIYVYDPTGKLETLHTEAAGLPEHLCTTVEDPYFQPKKSGNYSFLIVNDLRESIGAANATLMLIENVECNRWHQQFLQGKVNFVHVYNTTWAYEFSASSDRVEVRIDVPDTLDMYEARLYVMGDPAKNKGSTLDGVPLAWAPGLNGTLDSTGLYGGYNLDDEGYKISKATASCEYFGEDVLINYTSPLKGDTVLYHLVLIGENGNGTLRFMVKTDFDPPEITILDPVWEVASVNGTTITANVTDQDVLKSVTLDYSVDSWKTSTSLQMSNVVNVTYAATIPAQIGGTTVNYRVEASDTAENLNGTLGSYVVKDATTLELSLLSTRVYINERAVVMGQMSAGGTVLNLTYSCGSTEEERYIYVNQNGSFTDTFAPTKIGNWTVHAFWRGDAAHFNVTSETLNFTVQKVPTSLDVESSVSAIDLGGKVTITGTVSPIIQSKAIELQFTMPNSTVITKYTYTQTDGTFEYELTPETIGTWSIQARLSGDSVYLPSTSASGQFVVNDTWMHIILTFLTQYIMYIVAVAGAAAASVGFLIYWRRRE